MSSSRNILFTPQAFEDFTSWVNENKKVFFKISELIEETRRNPFEGKGKPEALKYDFKGFWSRRITDEHCIDLQSDSRYNRILFVQGSLRR
ncbi:Txe/YoeB family addiction module toxin [Runella rosea]|uniref:Txe/YoeB family addiction module toxin n=1 Tax=Runella rosea TaxID=2259595 RepID=UPI0026A354EC|nr:Txe/YoeB family addiction module toxin [Runella rosea]